MTKSLWEIFVPRSDNDGSIIEHYVHLEWDSKVCRKVGGLTLYATIKGKYQNSDIIVDQIIPVRIVCTADEICQIAQMTCEHYNQESVLYWEVSPNVTIWKNYKSQKQ